MPLSDQTILAQARQCLAIERAALTATAKVLGRDFIAVVRAVESAVAAGHKVIFSGVGKNAHIAEKLTGTFNSIGVPSCFLDPTQALHGDLGLCAEGDVAIMLSNSGATGEMLRLLPLFEKFGLDTVALTGAPDSELARGADYRLLYSAPREACPLALAPTASTTAALALGRCPRHGAAGKPRADPRGLCQIPPGGHPRHDAPAPGEGHHAHRRCLPGAEGGRDHRASRHLRHDQGQGRRRGTRGPQGAS
jgi:D-arabinose 5-phosphate isomerase GutQ